MEGRLTGAGTVGGGGGVRTCRVVVGTSTAGWTAADCDYLCDGTDDQVEIQAAIDSLATNYTYGEILLLQGTYNLDSYPKFISTSKAALQTNGYVTSIRGEKGVNLTFNGELSAGRTSYGIYDNSGCSITNLDIGCTQTPTSSYQFAGIFSIGGKISGCNISHVNVGITGNKLEVSGCSITFFKRAISLTSGSLSNIHHNTILFEEDPFGEGDEDGVGIYLAAETVKVVSNYINAGTGIIMTKGYNTVIGNTIEVGSYGIHITGSSKLDNVIVVGNIFYGISPVLYSGSNSALKNSVICDNVFDEGQVALGGNTEGTILQNNSTSAA